MILGILIISSTDGFDTFTMPEPVTIIEAEKKGLNNPLKDDGPEDITVCDEKKQRDAGK